jgi:signal transduction histidine kinase
MSDELRWIPARASRLLTGPATRSGTLGRSAQDWLVDTVLFGGSAVLGAVTFGYLWHDHGPVFNIVDIVAGSVACLALWVRRRQPVTVLLIAFVTASFSPLALFAGLVAVFNAALRVPRRRTLAALSVLMVACSVTFPLVNPKAGEVLKPAFPAFLLTVIAFGAGRLVRARRELIASLRARAEQLAADQVRQLEEAREHERRRLAREMHDVLAHRLSLLSIHAGALEFRPDAPPREVARAASVIRTSAASALDELRQVITLLREETATRTYAPPPTLNDLPELLEESRGAGMRLRTQLHIPEALPETLGRTAYRVIQEGLTNARKHAPGAEVDLSVSGSADTPLVVEVTTSRQPVALEPDGSASTVAINGTRSGLLGLAERVALAGGILEHGRNASGDFVLRATVPKP